MSVVNALLNKIVSQTVTNTTTDVTNDLTQAPTELGNAQIFVSNVVVNTTNETVQFDYLVVQYYNETKDTKQITFKNGTTSAISIPGISSFFPTVSINAIVTGSIPQGTKQISFSIVSTLNYSSITPTPYNVDVE